MRFILPLFISLLVFSCTKPAIKVSNPTTPIQLSAQTKARQDSIIDQHLKKGAWTKGLYSREWQEEIDKGLAKDSTIAYLWQQKSMPLYKQGKYELGKTYIDKAVIYKPSEWQPYRAFMTCIFAKTYRAAIKDFEDCIARFGDNYEMDHSYSFYIALSKIQLNEFAEAEQLLQTEVDRQVKNQGEDWVHHLDLFYLGIAKYEQGKYEEAITVFDKALKLYPEFSEVLYYKGNSLGRLGDIEAAKALTAEAKKYGKEGYTINEDNAIYERYPYQIRWTSWN